MASFGFTYAKAKLLSADIDLDADDIRMLMVMSNTTADTEKDAQFISGANGITTLDECDGENYVRKELEGEAVAADEENDRGEFDANDFTWTALGVGTRQNVGLLLYKHVATDADSIPIAYIDTGGFPFDGNGGNVTIQFNAEGILQAT